MRTRSLLLLGGLLLLSACASAPRHAPVVVQPTPAPRPVLVVCPDCGRIERVDMVSNVRATAKGGAVLGGVVGGVVTGAQTAATKPGVQVLTFRIWLRMDTGRRLTVHQSEIASGLRTGSRVRLVNGRVVASR
jgi:hypothetical protein